MEWNYHNWKLKEKSDKKLIFFLFNSLDYFLSHFYITEFIEGMNNFWFCIWIQWKKNNKLFHMNSVFIFIDSMFSFANKE